MSFFREAADIGNNIVNLASLFLPLVHRKNEFTEYCQQILDEAEAQQHDYYKAGDLNFIDILLKNKANLSSREIHDEVSTMILVVSDFESFQNNLILIAYESLVLSII